MGFFILVWYGGTELFIKELIMHIMDNWLDIMLHQKLPPLVIFDFYYLSKSRRKILRD